MFRVLPAPHSNIQALFWMKMVKNKPLVRRCSACSAREQSYSLREWSCMHLGLLSVTLQREMDYLNLLYHCFIHRVLPFTSYMTLGSNSTSSEKPCTLATSSSLIHCFHSCKKMGSNHTRARMPSAQPEPKQLCCASSSEVPQTEQHFQLMGHKGDPGAGMNKGCATREWDRAASQQLLQGDLENPIPGGSKSGLCGLHQDQVPAVDAAPSQDINCPRQKEKNERHVLNSSTGSP